MTRRRPARSSRACSTSASTSASRRWASWRTRAARAAGRTTRRSRSRRSSRERPGVYVFRDRADQILYVGKANDLRSRVKSYFYGDERKKVQDLVASVTRIEALTTGGELEALVLEIRLIAKHLPRFNAHGKRWRRFAYVKLDPAEAWPRLKIARAVDAERRGDLPRPVRLFGERDPREGGAGGVLPHPPMHARDGPPHPIRRAVRSPTWAGARPRATAAPMPERYGAMVDELLAALRAPGRLLRGLEARMHELAAQERFEEAALARDRVRALADVLARTRIDRWLTAGRLVVAGPGGERLELAGGALVRRDGGLGAGGPIGAPAPRERADELSVVRSWVAAQPRAGPRGRHAAGRAGRRGRGARPAARPDPRRRGTGRGPSQRSRPPRTCAVPVPTRR